MEDFIIEDGILIKYTGQDSIVKIPDSVTSIGTSAFWKCETLTSVTIPNSVTSIGCYAFCECKNLTDVEIPNSVTRIGESAFAGCYVLRNIMIPDSVTDIGIFMFEGCKMLENINVAKGNTHYTSIDGVLYDKEKKTLIRCPLAKTNINIPDSVTRIGVDAFWNCQKLKNIIIPNSVINIGYSTFWGCILLNYNEYDNAIYVGNKDNPFAFLICAKSTDITTCKIKETCICIGEGAFKGREALKSIEIPDSVTRIGNCAFLGCKTLTNITISGNIISIGWQAFMNCTKLARINIPNNIISIGSGVFKNCTGLKNIIIGNDINIDVRTFKGLKIKHKPKGNIAYKGFNADMTCRDFQYKEGETYTCDTAHLCECGFHACLNPLDCFHYYYDEDVVYHEVILEDRSSETGDDSKICGKKITIGRQLTIQEMFAIFNELNKD